MKINVVFTFLLIALLVTSCTSPTASALPTETPLATLQTAIPPTQESQLTLQTNTILFSGPGNVDFDALADLKAGGAVHPLGRYADFVKVTANVKGSETVGYVHKVDLGELPNDLTELSAEMIPLSPLFIPQCLVGVSSPTPDVHTFENNSDNYLPLPSLGNQLEEPLRLRLDGLTVSGSSYGSIVLLGRLSASSDWWKDQLQMNIGDHDGKYEITFRDGTDNKIHYFLSDLGLNTSETMQIVFEQVEGKSFQVLDENGKLIRVVDLTQQPGLTLPNGLFPDRQVYIGASVPAQSMLTVRGLQIGIPSKGRWVENDSLYPGLADLAAIHNLTIGTEFSTQQNMNLRYCRTMHRDFNLVVLGSLSLTGSWSAPGQYDFSAADRDLEYALNQGWQVRGTALWGEAAVGVPEWLRNSQLTRAEYIEILEQHIKTVVGRYKGQVQEWSIANEAISRSCAACKGGTDFWNQKIGPEYVEMAFRWAHEADPHAILILNETNNEDPRDDMTRAVFDRMYERVKDLKSKDVPLDVVGMQMHLLLKYSSPIPPVKEDVLATMKKFADLGVKIEITEFDVDLHNVAGTEAERLQFEADLYKGMLEACLESNACNSFTTWGVSDANSWITQICSDSWCINHADGAPLMFDNNYEPKPAYFAVRSVLENFSDPTQP